MLDRRLSRGRGNLRRRRGREYRSPTWTAETTAQCESATCEKPGEAKIADMCQQSKRYLRRVGFKVGTCALVDYQLIVAVQLTKGSNFFARTVLGNNGLKPGD
jgi:hypothetical protein